MTEAGAFVVILAGKLTSKIRGSRLASVTSASSIIGSVSAAPVEKRAFLHQRSALTVWYHAGRIHVYCQASPGEAGTARVHV